MHLCTVGTPCKTGAKDRYKPIDKVINEVNGYAILTLVGNVNKFYRFTIPIRKFNINIKILFWIVVHLLCTVGAPKRKCAKHKRNPSVFYALARLGKRQRKRGTKFTRYESNKRIDNKSIFV